MAKVAVTHLRGVAEMTRKQLLALWISLVAVQVLSFSSVGHAVELWSETISTGLWAETPAAVEVEDIDLPDAQVIES